MEKYPILALECAFNKVANPADWKKPINARITLDPRDVVRDLDLIRDAVIFYTGSVPKFTKLSDISPIKGPEYKVEALGYYITVGA